LQELSSVSQVSWETIIGISTLLLVQFGKIVNHVTNFWRCWQGLMFKHKAIWAFESLLDFVMCFFFMFSFKQLIHRCL